VEHEEKRERKERENGERVFVPVGHRETAEEEGTPEKLSENIWKMPRRWHVY
jgi:hypothetical protein